MLIDNMQTTPSAQTQTPAQPRPHAVPTVPQPQPLRPVPQPSISHPKPPKMPILRAHTVQIKILENHQNGKDTHLRGLQIFALDNDKVREEERVKPRVTKVQKPRSGSDKWEMVGDQKPLGGERGQMGLMRGLMRSEWDVEGSIR